MMVRRVAICMALAACITVVSPVWGDRYHSHLLPGDLRPAAEALGIQDTDGYYVLAAFLEELILRVEALEDDNCGSNVHDNSALDRSGATSITHVSGLRIAYIDYANNEDEVVVLFNAERHDINLEGFRIASQSGREFVFAESRENPRTPIIRAFDVVRVHSRRCDPFDDERNFNWINADGSCTQQHVWNDEGGTALLFAPGSTTPLAEYSYP